MLPTTSDRLIGIEECKKHTTDKSCWIVVHGKVYDVTDFLEEHPGGYDIILTATGSTFREGRAWEGAEEYLDF
jgi:cytochrome b involved in lipid metabolism